MIPPDTNPTALNHAPLDNCLEDTRLSMKAKGIMLFICANQIDGCCHSDTIIDAAPDGPTSVESGIKELVKFGYISIDDNEKNGFIYLIHAHEDVYKIGKTKSPRKRFKILEVKLPFPIEVKHMIPSNDYSRAEKQLHEKFTKKRIRGEWFKLNKKDVAWIESIKKMNFDNDGVTI